MVIEIDGGDYMSKGYAYISDKYDLCVSEDFSVAQQKSCNGSIEEIVQGAEGGYPSDFINGYKFPVGIGISDEGYLVEIEGLTMPYSIKGIYDKVKLTIFP